jgi:hypothetical protein
MGLTIQEIVKNSGNKVWQVRLADVLTTDDLVSRDIMYHNRCKTMHWEKYVQRPKRKAYRSQNRTSQTSQTSQSERSIPLLAAEVQFCCTIQEQIDKGMFLDIATVENMYDETLCEYEIMDGKITRQALTKKIMQNVNNVIITPSYGSKPSQVHSSEASKAAINTASEAQGESVSQDFKLLFQCARQLRSVVQKARLEPWTFTGSLINCAGAGVPQELMFFVRWMIQSPNSVCSEYRSKEIECSVNLICQQILNNFKSDRQIKYNPRSSTSSLRSCCETPPSVGLSLHSHHNHRSKKDIALLSAASVGISYRRVNEITNEIAESALDCMNNHGGIYIPPKLYKGIPVRGSADNIDAKVDTPDGKNSFHGTASSVYQRTPIDENQATVCKPLELSRTLKHVIKDVPSTVVQLLPCNIRGSPKPPVSPHYADYKLGQHTDKMAKAQQCDLLWLCARYIQRSLPHLDGSDHANSSDNVAYSEHTQGIPVWKAYNSQVHISTDSLDKSSSLPIINAPAHEWQTLVTVLENLHKLNRIACPDDAGKIMVTFDMDLYKRALKLEYLNRQFKEKWWLLPGPFHISLCAIRCLGKTIEHSGIDEAQ